MNVRGLSGYDATVMFGDVDLLCSGDVSRRGTKLKHRLHHVDSEIANVRLDVQFDLDSKINWRAYRDLFPVQSMLQRAMWQEV